MTSGTFQTFPLSSIWINRDKRQRRELRDIESLAESINRVGLIHPPVIRRDGELIVGERRVTAMRSLGWTDAPVQFIEDLSQEELHKVELEENVRRLDLTWQEQCAAVKEYHELRSAEEGWSQKKTAEALGFAQSSIGNFLSVAEELKSGNAKVVAAPKFSTAVNITARKLERKKAATLETITPVSSPEPEPTKPVAPLICADFIEWSYAYTGRKFNLIHCDFPYGVNMQDSDQSARFEFGEYQDAPDVYWKLLDALALAMDNVVHESAHLIFWFSMDFYSETLERLEEMGWKVSPFPLIWMKSDNTGIIPDANRGPRRIYETAFFASRGDRKIVSPVSNAFAAPGKGKEIHMNEKPVAMLQHFLRMLVDEYTIFLDPTAGSANAVKAARNLGAGTVLGIEQNTEFFNLASERFFDVLASEI